MVQKTFPIALDIKRPTANPDFEIVLGDNGNVLEVTLTDDGTAVNLTGCLVCAIFSKSDGNTAQQDNDGHGIAVSGNLLTISLYTTSAAPGLVECELQVYSGPDKTTLVTSAKFNFMCRRGIANDDTIEATDEWPILVGMMQRVEAAEDAEMLRVTAESTRVSNENTRIASETARNTAEGNRATAEAARTGAEDARAASESGRVTAENTRVTAENTRLSNESMRGTAESERAAAEATRINQEAGRVSAEASRVTAEGERATRDAEYRKLEPYNPVASYVPLNKVTYGGSCYQCIQATTGNIPTNTTYWALIARAGEGSGDMLKEVYDTNNSGVVDDAERLGGQLPSHYATAVGLSAHTGNTSNPHGVTRAQIGAAGAAVEYSTYLPAAGWSGTGPWQQTITVTGITAAMVPFIEPALADDGWNIPRLEAFACIDRIVTSAGSITAYCYRQKPVDDVGIRLRVVQ